MSLRTTTFVALLLAGMLAFFFHGIARAQCADLHLNEIDYDQDGTDTAEFIEIKGSPGATLAGLDLHLVNGLNADVYRTEPLTGTIPANGYLVIGSLEVAEVDIMLGAGGANLIQNGAPDGAGLWDRDGNLYCDFINYEGIVAGFEAWPNIGTDSAASCAAGASTSLSRREATPPEEAWMPGACATPGTANESPTALKLTTLSARVKKQPSETARLLIASAGSALSLLAISGLARGGRAQKHKNRNECRTG